MPSGAGPKPIGRDLYQAPKRLTYTSGSRPPCHCEKRSDKAISHPASASALPRGGLRRRFASRNDRHLAQLAAGESMIRAPGIRCRSPRGFDLPGNLRALRLAELCQVVLYLQVQPEFRLIAEIPAQTQRCL